MEFDDKDLYLENGVLAKGQPFTLLGPGGLGKSRLLLHLAVCTILGKSFLGMSVQSKGLKWLVLQGENSNRRLQADLKALQAWVGEVAWKSVEPLLVIHTLEVPEDSDLSLGNEYVAAELSRVIAEAKPDVIAVDPLVGFAAGSLNNDAGMQKTCSALIKLARAGGEMPSLVVLHHTLTGKAGAARASGYDRGSYGRGSKALNFWTRGQINIAANSPDNNDRLVVSCGKNSNGREFEPFGIRLDAETLVYELDEEFDLAEWHGVVTGAAKPTAKDKLTPEKVAEFVAEVPRVKKELVKAIMDETGCEKSTAYNAIGAAEGVTIRRNKGKKFEPVV